MGPTKPLSESCVFCEASVGLHGVCRNCRGREFQEAEDPGRSPVPPSEELSRTSENRSGTKQANRGLPQGNTWLDTGLPIDSYDEANYIAETVHLLTCYPVEVQVDPLPIQEGSKARCIHGTKFIHGVVRFNDKAFQGFAFTICHGREDCPIESGGMPEGRPHTFKDCYIIAHTLRRQFQHLPKAGLAIKIRTAVNLKPWEKML